MRSAIAWFLVLIYPLHAGALDLEGVNAAALHRLGITGQGVQIALLSHGNVLTRHEAFRRPSGSAAINHDFTGAGTQMSVHDTNMAGLLVSSGTAARPGSIGIAPGSRVHSARVIAKGIEAAAIAQALETLITKHNCRVVVTGIQLPPDQVSADGNSPWTKLYDYYAEKYDVVFVNAAGNQAPRITVFGDCFNGLTTAALCKDQSGVYCRVGRLSNSGPTLDGRRKPEVAAPSQALIAPSSASNTAWMTVDPNGLGLTSFAAPFTTGTAALLLEAAARSSAENDDRTEVIKAVIVNSVSGGLKDKKQNPAAADNALSTWNPDAGYGRVNALKAYRMLEAGAIAEGKLSKQQMGWAYAVMPKKSEHVYKIEMAKERRLVLTAVWHRKLNKVGPIFVEEPVRFALDMKVVSPSGQMIVFETAGPNNLIKTDCPIKEDGVYQIILRNNTEADGRDYGIAFESISDD
ncbi:MAG: S8 family serine peptidase [Planctomycetaceae bacterium]|nr:S8 family serine peptidase [Planctomycetaceae bacterium]